MTPTRGLPRLTSPRGAAGARRASISKGYRVDLESYRLPRFQNAPRRRALIRPLARASFLLLPFSRLIPRRFSSISHEFHFVDTERERENTPLEDTAAGSKVESLNRRRYRAQWNRAIIMSYRDNERPRTDLFRCRDESRASGSTRKLAVVLFLPIKVSSDEGRGIVGRSSRKLVNVGNADGIPSDRLVGLNQAIFHNRP